MSVTLWLPCGRDSVYSRLRKQACPPPGSPMSEKNKDHAIRQPIENIIAARLQNAEIISMIVDDIMTLLGDQNIIQIGKKASTSLMTPAGKILCLLCWRPNMTVREISVMLGTTETNINKAISKLMKDKLISRKRRLGRYEYSVVFDNAKTHQDLRMLFALLGVTRSA